VNDVLDQIKTKNPDLKKAEIAGILYILKTSQQLTNNELVRQTGITKEMLKHFKASIGNMLVDSQSDSVELSTYGREILTGIELFPYKWSLVDYDNSVVQQELEAIRTKHNLTPKREYDQFFATAKTSVAKASVINAKGMVENKSIALLGDDDLISVTLGIMFPHYNRITVFDIDSDILEPIKAIVAEQKLKNITTKIYDARKPVNQEDVGKYDVVMTDPPYTPAGIALFLNRAIQFLGKSTYASEKYIFLCYSNSLKSPEKTLKIQEIIQQYNLVIEDKIDKFNRYYGAEAIGSASSLYILKLTPHTKVLDNYLNEAIYTFETKKEEKFPFVDHFTFKIYDVPAAVVNSKKALLKATHDLCTAHKLKVLDTKITEFKKQGLTITFVLGSSNLLVHTWPELNALHIDLITCDPISNKEKLIYNVSAFYKSSAVEMRKVE